MLAQWRLPLARRITYERWGFRDASPGDQQLVEHEWCSTKAQINGSLCHITATFGMAIAGMVINHIIE